MKKSFAILAIFTTLALCVSCNTAKSNQTDTPPTENPAAVYTIADYYNESGALSDLGLALEEENSEKVLSINNNALIVVGERKYRVTTETIKLPVYTQPSYDEVMRWWTEHLDSLVENGELATE